MHWQYAKTMPEWPHEYTIKGWRPDLVADFEAFCRLIASWRVVEPWPAPPERAIYRNRYLVIDEHKYWAMGPHGDKDFARRSSRLPATSPPARARSRPRGSHCHQQDSPWGASEMS